MINKAIKRAKVFEIILTLGSSDSLSSLVKE
jgi:hypothetical protein